MRAVMAEHRTPVPHFDGLGIIPHAMHNISPHHSGGAFRTQTDPGAVAVFKNIHLFVHDISPAAQRTHEQTGLFHNRSINATELKILGQIFSRMINFFPILFFLGQNIMHPAHQIICLAPFFRLHFFFSVFIRIFFDLNFNFFFFHNF